MVKICPFLHQAAKFFLAILRLAVNFFNIQIKSLKTSLTIAYESRIIPEEMTLEWMVPYKKRGKVGKWKSYPTVLVFSLQQFLLVR